MPYKYRDPSGVLSPKHSVQKVIVIFDGKTNEDHPFSIAKILWKGKWCIGIRWNINQNEWGDPNKKSGKNICIGEPNSRGYPTWFIIPKEFLQLLLSEKSELSKILKKAISEIN